MNTTYKVNDNQIKNKIPVRLYIAYGSNNKTTEVVYSCSSSYYDALKKFSKEHPEATFADMEIYDKKE